MRSSYCALIAGIVLIFVANGLRADERKIEPNRLPKAVVNAVNSKYRGAQILSAEEERSNGRTQYEVSIKHNNQNIEITLTDRGTIVLIAKEIKAADLPKPILESLVARYPGANASRIQEIDEQGKVSYAIQFPGELQRLTVRFDAAGLPIEKPAAASTGHQMTIQIGDLVICRADYAVGTEGARLVKFTSLNQEIRPAGAASFDQAGTTRVVDQFLYSARSFGQSGLIPLTEADVLAVMRLLNPAVSPQLDIWGNWTREAAVGILLRELDQTRASTWQSAWYDLAGKDLAERTMVAKELIGLGREALRPSDKSRDEKKR